jgi:hypothetical protein
MYLASLLAHRRLDQFGALGNFSLKSRADLSPGKGVVFSS